MHGITVSLVQTPQHLAVVVDTGGAGDDLLLAVAVHIGSHAVVVAVAVAGNALVVSGVKRPAFHQLFVDHVIRCSCHAGVIASSGDNTGLAAVQICHSAPEAVDTVAVAVAPLGNCAAGRFIVHGVHPILVGALAAAVQITGGFSGVAGVDQRVVPVQLEHGTVRIVGEKPPADQHAGTGVDGGNAAVQIFHLAVAGGRCSHGCLRECAAQHGQPRCGSCEPCCEFVFLHKHSPRVIFACRLFGRSFHTFFAAKDLQHTFIIAVRNNNVNVQIS